MSDTEKKFDISKAVPIVISVVALFLSFLGFRESQRNTRINEAIDRPNLTMTGLTARMMTQEDYLRTELQIKIKNTGKTSAKVERATIRPNLYSTESCVEVTSGPADGALDDWNSSISIAPGREEPLAGQIRLSKGCSQQQSIKLFLFVFIEYADQTTNIQYSQYLPQAFELPLAELKEKQNETVNIPL